MKRPQTYQNVPQDDDTGEPAEYPPGGARRQTVPAKGPGFNQPRRPNRAMGLDEASKAATSLQKLIAAIRKTGGRRVVK